MKRLAGMSWILACAIALVGCVPVAGVATGVKKRPGASDAAPKSPEDASAPKSAFTGVVLGLDGLPAAGVTVRGHLVSNNGGGLLSDQGSSYRVLAAGDLATKTDAEGRFTLKHPEGQALNLEAIKSDEAKAIRFRVAADATDVKLQLAPTGTVTGKVTAPKAPSVTNFQGVSVYVPGTSYAARTDAEGRYTITHMPAGTFTLAAEKTGLGEATATGVEVQSSRTVEAPALALSVQAPAVTSITPPNAGPGTEITIKGERFGASTGAPLEVRIGGVDGVSVNRVDDTTITVKVPENGGSDGVVVKVNQIASASAPFQVIKSLALTPAVRYLVAGATQQYQATATDTAGKPVASPHVAWTIAEGAAAIGLADGLVTAKAQGAAMIHLSAGSIVKKQPILVVASADQLPANETLTWATQLAVTAAGIYAVSWDQVVKINSDGTTVVVAGEGAPAGADFAWQDAQCMVADAAGALYVADGSRLYKFTPGGAVMPFAGSAASGASVDGAGTSASFISISRLTIDGAGHLYALDAGTVSTSLRKITPAGAVTTLPGGSGLTTLAAAPDGTLYVTDGQTVSRLSGGTLTAIAEAEDGFTEIDRMVVQDGLIYAVDVDFDAGSSRIVTIDPADGAVTPLDLGMSFSDYVGGLGFSGGRLLVLDADQGKLHRFTLP